MDLQEKIGELCSKIIAGRKGVFNYNRFSYMLKKTRMTQEDIKYLLISLSFTQVLVLWMSLPWVNLLYALNFPLFQGCLCLKSKQCMLSQNN